MFTTYFILIFLSLICPHPGGHTLLINILCPHPGGQLFIKNIMFLFKKYFYIKLIFKIKIEFNIKDIIFHYLS